MARIMRLEQECQSVKTGKGKADDAALSKRKASSVMSGGRSNVEKTSADGLPGKVTCGDRVCHSSQAASSSHGDRIPAQRAVCASQNCDSVQQRNSPRYLRGADDRSLQAGTAAHHGLEQQLKEAVALADRRGKDAEVLRRELEEQRQQHGQAMHELRDTCDEKMRRAVQAAHSWGGPQQEGTKEQLVVLRQKLAKSSEECSAEKQRKDALQAEVAMLTAQMEGLWSEVQDARVCITMQTVARCAQVCCVCEQPGCHEILRYGFKSWNTP
jgi:hypothetical protein